MKCKNSVINLIISKDLKAGLPPNQGIQRELWILKINQGTSGKKKDFSRKGIFSVS